MECDMADFPTQARVVIIGGGAVGVSGLYHLCKAGWTDCVLLEKNELTAGSTWHAAGNVPTFSSSWSIMNMQRYSAGLYRGLGAEVDYPMNYHVTGSVRLGHSRERLQEFQRVVGMGRHQAMDLEFGEIIVFYPDGKGGTKAVARIRADKWPTLALATSASVKPMSKQ